jgi:hypothetical protein
MMRKRHFHDLAECSKSIFLTRQRQNLPVQKFYAIRNISPARSEVATGIKLVTFRIAEQGGRYSGSRIAIPRR